MSGRYRIVAGALRTLVVLAVVGALALVILNARNDLGGTDDEHPPMLQAGVTAVSGRIWVSGGLYTNGGPRARLLVEPYAADGGVAGPSISLQLPEDTYLAGSTVALTRRGLVLLGQTCQVPEEPSTACEGRSRLAAWLLDGRTADRLDLIGPAATPFTGRLRLVGSEGNVVSVARESGPADEGATPRIDLVRIDVAAGGSRVIDVPAVAAGLGAICLTGDRYLVLSSTDAGSGERATTILARTTGGTAWTTAATVSASGQEPGPIDAVCRDDRVLWRFDAGPYRLGVITVPGGKVQRPPSVVRGPSGSEARALLTAGPNDRTVIVLPNADRRHAAWYLEYGGALKSLGTRRTGGQGVQPAVVNGRIYDLGPFDPNGLRGGRPGRATLVH